jgi:hypothetical protein
MVGWEDMDNDTNDDNDDDDLMMILNVVMRHMIKETPMI